MANEIPTMSLKGFNFNPIQLTPIEYKPQAEDLSILERGLAQRDARRTAASQQVEAIDKALGDIEKQLNKAELPWFNDYKAKIKEDINNQINAGNYTNALNIAIKSAGEVAKDSAVLNRIKANQDYDKQDKELQTRVDNKSIKRDTARYFRHINQYQYNAIYNEIGEEIGYEKAEYDIPYDDVNWDEESLIAFKLINPDESSSQWSRENRTNKENINITTGSSRGGSSSRKQVTKEEIIGNLRNRFNNNSDLVNKTKQDYKVRLFRLKEWEDQLKNMDENNPEYQSLKNDIEKEKNILYENGSAIVGETTENYFDYYVRNVEKGDVIKNMAYLSTSTSSTIGNSYIQQSTSSGNGSGSGDGGVFDDRNKQYNSTGPGKKVTITTTPLQEGTETAEKIVNSFPQPK